MKCWLMYLLRSTLFRRLSLEAVGRQANNGVFVLRGADDGVHIGMLDFTGFRNREEAVSFALKGARGDFVDPSERQDAIIMRIVVDRKLRPKYASFERRFRAKLPTISCIVSKTIVDIKLIINCGGNQLGVECIISKENALPHQCQIVREERFIINQPGII